MSHEAQALRLSGWARNRDDGAVEAEFEGEREALEQMLDWCETGPAFANVANVEAHWEEGGAAKYSGFRIRG
jgi:acylphosphatase